MDDAFIDHFKYKQHDAHLVNLGNGWWDERSRIREILQASGINPDPHIAIELLGLCGTEISEAIEAARNHPVGLWDNANTKDTMVRECAGAVVRLMDFCEYYRLPLAEAINAEIEHNRTRGRMHGGKSA